MIYHTDIDSLITSVDRVISNDLKELIKAKLMPHAEKVVDEVAMRIAEGMRHEINTWKQPTGEVEIHLHLGPKDSSTHMKQVVTHEVVEK